MRLLCVIGILEPRDLGKSCGRGGHLFRDAVGSPTVGSSWGYATMSGCRLPEVIRNLVIRGVESDRDASYPELKFLVVIPCSFQRVGPIEFKRFAQRYSQRFQ